MENIQCIVCILLLNVLSTQCIFQNKIIVLKGNITLKTMLQYLAQFGFSFIEQLTPNLYIFEGKTNITINKGYLQSLQNTSDGQIEDIELITLHVNAIQRDPEPVVAVPYTDHYEQVKVDFDVDYGLNSNQQQYGMGIPEAWNLGYSGDGVIIAVIDVGVDIGHPDLSKNINKVLSFNFVGGQYVYPERFPNSPETLSFTDHGNRCCGLIAASKINTLCNVGIAYNASIAVLKTFKVTNMQGGRISFLSDTILRGLIYRLHEIDIYSNSWTINEPFAVLKFSSQEVLSYGITIGRKEKGSVYVFPVGKVAEGYSNSKYTITVGSIGVNGRIPGYTDICACVLTSAFGEGVDINSTNIITTSHSDEKCTRDFKGTSASATMVSAMLALALQANENLTWRDVQHIIVKASTHEGMHESESFKQNGAGRYCKLAVHPYFGFGILNAAQLTTLAKTWTTVQQQVTHTNKSFILKNLRQHEHTAVASASKEMTCSDECDIIHACVDKIEHVEVTISYISPNEENLKITLTSPSRTHSILMDRWQSYAGDKLRHEVKFLSVNFWGENPNGTWILRLHQHGHDTGTAHQSRFSILFFSLSISGTKRKCVHRTTKMIDSSTKNTPTAENTHMVHIQTTFNMKPIHFITSTAFKFAGSIILIIYPFIYYKKMLMLI